MKRKGEKINQLENALTFEQTWAECSVKQSSNHLEQVRWMIFLTVTQSLYVSAVISQTIKVLHICAALANETNFSKSLCVSGITSRH